MRGRAFTLLETTLAIALLAVLAVSATAWSVSVLRLRADTLSADRHARAIEVLERILRADLMNEDLAGPAKLRRTERVWIAENQLHILTRVAGDAEAVYRFHENQLHRSVRPLRSDGMGSTNLVLDQVDHAGFDISTDEEQPWAVLTVTIRTPDTPPASIRIAIPEAWTR